jgi:hypothetical protein
VRLYHWLHICRLYLTKKIVRANKIVMLSWLCMLKWLAKSAQSKTHVQKSLSTSKICSSSILLLNILLKHSPGALWNSLQPWYSRFSQIPLGNVVNIRLVKPSQSVQKRNFNSNQHSKIIIPEPLLTWGCVNIHWKPIEVIYNFVIIHFSWIYTERCQLRFL